MHLLMLHAVAVSVQHRALWMTRSCMPCMPQLLGARALLIQPVSCERFPGVVVCICVISKQAARVMQRLLDAAVVASHLSLSIMAPRQAISPVLINHHCQGVQQCKEFANITTSAIQLLSGFQERDTKTVSGKQKRRRLVQLPICFVFHGKSTPQPVEYSLTCLSNAKLSFGCQS